MASKKKTTSKPKDSVLGSFSQGKPPGFMRNRFLAMIIDFIIIGLICQLLFILFKKPDWGGYLQMQAAVKGLAKADPLVIERARLYEECFIFTLGVGVVYELITLIPFGTTVGKLIFKLRVVDYKDGRNVYVSKLMLVLRSLLKALSIYLLTAIPFILMCITAFASTEGRSGFDMFAGTRIIDIRGKKK